MFLCADGALTQKHTKRRPIARKEKTRLEAEEGTVTKLKVESDWRSERLTGS